MSTLFAQTIAKAISDYRQFLRKYLKQSDRIRKLSELNLKDPEIYNNEVKLFEIAHGIIEDIQKNVEIPDQNYYSYSGIAKFCEFLKEYLDNYELENNRVIHKAQKASRAMLKAIQILNQPKEKLNETVAGTLIECNEVIATCGSEEQLELHAASLERHKPMYEEFYRVIIDDFKSRLNITQDAQETPDLAEEVAY